MSESPRTERSPEQRAAEAVELARRWVADAAEEAAAGEDAPGAAGRRLSALLAEPGGLDFASAVVDGLARPHDLVPAGIELHRVAGEAPDLLPWRMRQAARLGGALAPGIPWVVVPPARRILGRLVEHLVIDEDPKGLGPALRGLREGGAVPDLAPLGDAPLGEREVERRADAVRTLLERPDVDRLTVPVDAVASGLDPWAFEESTARVVERLAPLFELAATRGVRVTLAIGGYGHLDLTIAVLQRLLDRPDLHHVQAGITLPASLPDALDALQGLTEWATRRRAAGDAALTVRLVKGAHLAAERAEAERRGWPCAAYDEKVETDANLLRLLDWALTGEHCHAVRVQVATHDLFALAYAWLLARDRGVDERVEYAMLLGVADGHARQVGRTVGGVVVQAPTAHPEDRDATVGYLLRRLDEAASPDGSAALEREGPGPEAFERRRTSFEEALDLLGRDEGPRGLAPLPNRTQDRGREWQDADPSLFFHPPAPEPGDPDEAAPGLTSVVLGLSRGDAPPSGVAPVDILGPFRGEPDTDPALPANRSWARRILGRVRESDVGAETLGTAALGGPGELERILVDAGAAGGVWGGRSGFDRAAVLDRVGLALAANRDRLVEAVLAEVGGTLAEADPEVSAAVDFAHYYAARARELDTAQGAVFVPPRTSVVVADPTAPVSSAAGGVLGALAAGSAVLLVPGTAAGRCVSAVAEAIWEAGIPRGLFELVDPGEAGGETERTLYADPRVERVVFAGDVGEARRLRAIRPGLGLRAQTGGKNAIVVTPAADHRRAVRDVVASAFGRSGQDASAASLLILVGSAGRSGGFEDLLVDAVTSLRGAGPEHPGASVGRLARPADGNLRRALTELGAGEEWLVEPAPLDDTGALWSPGVRTGVVPGSFFHLTEFRGPVLGVMRARTLDEAIRIQNAVPFGLAAGLHSLDPVEIERWLDTVEAGNLYVNRRTTGALVGRQPLGGWKRSALGPGAKSGGPHFVASLGSWRTDGGRSSASLHLRGLDERVTALIESGQPAMAYDEFDRVRRSALSDEIAFATEFGEVRELAGLATQRNLLRYRPVPVVVRSGEGGTLPGLLRVLAAATLARAPFAVSSADGLPEALARHLADRGVPVVVESDARWRERVAADGIVVAEHGPEGLVVRERSAPRVRLFGGDEAALARALGRDSDATVYADAVTASGRVELLPFLREQSISIDADRHGLPHDVTAGLP